MSCYLDTNKKSDCTGCEACAQVCGTRAISMVRDKYGFYYPIIDKNSCVDCKKCRKVCPISGNVMKHNGHFLSFGGYIKDKTIRRESTSGGAFSAICKSFCDENYVIFGCTSKGIYIYHKYIDDVDNLNLFYSSKYGQSHMNNSYKKAKQFLAEGKKVIFSGTPCQIYALYKFLGDFDISKLLTIEVICTGIPSALFMDKFNKHCIKKYGVPIKTMNYRYTNKNKWDDQSSLIELENGKRKVETRWFSNFYSIFLQRLMSRPGCNDCKFVSSDRVADISLSDLWGVDREYPDLYDDGSGCSWIICNTKKGEEVFCEAKKNMIGHEVDFDTMKKYQRPGMIKKDVHKDYDLFMEDLTFLDYKQICTKWAKKPTPKLIFQKYIYNNRFRVNIWKLKTFFRL